MITLPVFLAAVAALSLLASAVSVATMWLDKRRARGNGWRIKESQLHLLELLGGWPGSLLASRWFRHKTVKPSYRVIRFACIVVHAGSVVALAWLIYGRG